MRLNQAFNLALSMATFGMVAATCRNLVLFLSTPMADVRPLLLSRNSIAAGRGNATWDWDDTIRFARPLLTDILLLLLFSAQHSLMALPAVKEALSYRMPVILRSIYVLCTCFALQALMRYWVMVPYAALWVVDTSASPTLWWTFVSAHFCCWVVLYASSLVMDWTELVGFKQIYYDIRGSPPPQSLKTEGLQRFYRHFRHPSLTGFCLVFWIYPQMRLDRTLLAVFMTFYMLMAWKADEQDYYYQKSQNERKQYEVRYARSPDY